MKIRKITAKACVFDVVQVFPLSETSRDCQVFPLSVARRGMSVFGDGEDDARKGFEKKGGYGQ